MSRSNQTSSHILLPRIFLLLSVLALVLIGFVMIYSTSSVTALMQAEAVQDARPMADVLNQMKFAVVGLVVALIVWKVFSYSFWQSNAVWVFWAIAFALLVATALFGSGEEEWGAKRWLVVGPMSLQASEFAKIALLLVSARLLLGYREGRYTARAFWVLLFVTVLLPVIIIVKGQSDLGTAMICIVGILAVMWLGGVSLRTIIAAVLIVAFVGIVGIVMEDYRRERLMVFMNPWNDGENGFGNGYQIIHSLYALAGGGVFGVGLGNSHEKFLYLTQSDTDFIFAIIGEELGLVGALIVVVLFLTLLYCGMRIARSAPDRFGLVMAGGLTIMIVFQAFLNIAMVIGWFPVVGKPLPFVSSGGSALVASFIMVGLILSVSRASDAPTIYERRRADLRVVRATEGNVAASRNARRSAIGRR